MRQTSFIRFAASAIGMLFVIGCGDVQVDVSDQAGVHVKVPGVEVKVNQQDGVAVQAPGTDVRVTPGGQVGVKAPTVDVNVSVDGVQVRSPAQPAEPVQAEQPAD